MQGNFITYIAKYFRELRVRSDSVVTLTQIENPIRGINNDNSNAQRGEENRHKMSKLSRHISLQLLFFFFFFFVTIAISTCKFQDKQGTYK